MAGNAGIKSTAPIKIIHGRKNILIRRKILTVNPSMKIPGKIFKIDQHNLKYFNFG
jgi:hypothetical protein